MKIYILFASLILAICFSCNKCKSSEEKIINTVNKHDSIKVYSYTLNAKNNIGFHIKNNLTNEITINYYLEGATKYILCNERKHDKSDNSWSLRTPFVSTGMIKSRVMKPNESDTFFVDVNYDSADTAIIVFTYDVRRQNEYSNTSYFLCLNIQNRKIIPFTPPDDIKGMLGVMNPNTLKPKSK